MIYQISDFSDYFQQFAHYNNKENIKTPHNSPLWGKSIDDWCLQYKMVVMPKAFPFHNVIMISAGSTEEDIEEFVCQLEIYSSIEAHPNVLHFYGVCAVGGTYFYVAYV